MPPSAHPALRTTLIALALWVGSCALGTVTMCVIAFSAGPSVAAGEQAALAVGLVLASLWLTAVVLFARFCQLPSIVLRVLATLVFSAFEAAILGSLFLMTLVLLNR